MSERLKSQPTEKEFAAFLAWLDPAPARAAEKYLLVSRKLRQYFTNRQCADADYLADKTIDRVIQKLPEIAPGYVGESMRYIHRVAHFIFLEYHHDQAHQPVSLPVLPKAEEQVHFCLEQCLNEFQPEERALVLDYYCFQGQEKIKWHDQMAEERGIEIGALRNRVLRLRKKLLPCIQRCLEKKLL